MIYTSPLGFCVISIYEVVVTMVSALCFDDISRWSQTLRRRYEHSPLTGSCVLRDRLSGALVRNDVKTPKLGGTNYELSAGGCTVVVLWL